MFNKINFPFLSVYIKHGEKQQLALVWVVAKQLILFFLNTKHSVSKMVVCAIDLTWNFTHTSSAFLCTNSSSDFR